MNLPDKPRNPRWMFQNNKRYHCAPPNAARISFLNAPRRTCGAVPANEEAMRAGVHLEEEGTPDEPLSNSTRAPDTPDSPQKIARGLGRGRGKAQAKAGFRGLPGNNVAMGPDDGPGFAAGRGAGRVNRATKAMEFVMDVENRDDHFSPAEQESSSEEFTGMSCDAFTSCDEGSFGR